MVYIKKYIKIIIIKVHFYYPIKEYIKLYCKKNNNEILLEEFKAKHWYIGEINITELNLGGEGIKIEKPKDL